MPKREELTEVTLTATTAEANLGTAVPQNMKRYIYRVKVVNKHTVANELTLGHRLGSASTTTLDKYQCSVQYETQVDPDEIKEDSLPIHEGVVGKLSGTDERYLRVVTDNGDMEITILYADGP